MKEKYTPDFRESAVGLVLVSVGVAASSHAQTATVRVQHSDPDGVVLPGETVRIQVLHSRSGTSILAGIGGAVTASDNLGVASNLSTQLIPSPPEFGYVNSLGTPSGGSVQGVSHEFFGHPAFVQWIHPAYMSWWTNVEVLSFDWTAPNVLRPTTIDFTWTPSGALPNVKAIREPFSQIIIEFLPTTSTGTSLLVIPAPASALLLVALALPRRRR